MSVMWFTCEWFPLSRSLLLRNCGWSQNMCLGVVLLYVWVCLQGCTERIGRMLILVIWERGEILSGWKRENKSLLM